MIGLAFASMSGLLRILTYFKPAYLKLKNRTRQSQIACCSEVVDFELIDNNSTVIYHLSLSFPYSFVDLCFSQRQLSALSYLDQLLV